VALGGGKGGSRDFDLLSLGVSPAPISGAIAKVRPITRATIFFFINLILNYLTDAIRAFQKKSLFIILWVYRRHTTLRVISIYF
jgi:hypothetical protein